MNKKFLLLLLLLINVPATFGEEVSIDKWIDACVASYAKELNNQLKENKQVIKKGLINDDVEFVDTSGVRRGVIRVIRVFNGGELVSPQIIKGASSSRIYYFSLVRGLAKIEFTINLDSEFTEERAKAIHNAVTKEINDITR